MIYSIQADVKRLIPDALLIPHLLHKTGRLKVLLFFHLSSQILQQFLYQFFSNTAFNFAAKFVYIVNR